MYNGILFVSSRLPPRRLPSQAEIFLHWSARDEFRINRKPEDEPFGCLLIAPAAIDPERPLPKHPIIGCFACGRPDSERAHILARAEGGSDNAENIHLLCGGCHTDSELLSGDSYWTWIRGVRRRSYADHYAIRYGYPDFESFCAAVAIAVVDGRFVRPEIMTPAQVRLIQDINVGTETLRTVPVDQIELRLLSSGLDRLLAPAIMACSASRAGGCLHSYLLQEIRGLTVRARSVRSSNAAHDRTPMTTRRRRLSPADQARRQKQKQERIDRIAMEYGYILLDMEEKASDFIARHMDELDVPSPYGRKNWTALAVKMVTARYRALIRGTVTDCSADDPERSAEWPRLQDQVTA